MSMGHYAGQCSLKKIKGVEQVATGIVARVEEITSQFETAFSMAFFLSTNTLSSVGWFVRGLGR